MYYKFTSSTSSPEEIGVKFGNKRILVSSVFDEAQNKVDELFTLINLLDYQYNIYDPFFKLGSYVGVIGFVIYNKFKLIQIEFQIFVSGSLRSIVIKNDENIAVFDGNEFYKALEHIKSLL